MSMVVVVATSGQYTPAAILVTGGWRHDAAHLVAVDGLITEQERQELLDWLTAPGTR
jgi:hypothetical protein